MKSHVNADQYLERYGSVFIKCVAADIIYGSMKGKEREDWIEDIAAGMKVLTEVSDSDEGRYVSLLRHEDELVCQTVDLASDEPLCSQHYGLMGLIIDLVSTERLLIGEGPLADKAMKDVTSDIDIFFPVVLREAVRRFSLRYPQFRGKSPYYARLRQREAEFRDRSKIYIMTEGGKIAGEIDRPPALKEESCLLCHDIHCRTAYFLRANLDVTTESNEISTHRLLNIKLNMDSESTKK